MTAAAGGGGGMGDFWDSARGFFCIIRGIGVNFFLFFMHRNPLRLNLIGVNRQTGPPAGLPGKGEGYEHIGEKGAKRRCGCLY